MNAPEPQERLARLYADLGAEPWRFDLFQALRWLESLHPQRPRLGRSRRPAEDVVRLGQRPDLSFAPASVAEFQAPGAGAPARLRSWVFGLLGPNGPLPIHLSEYVRERERHHGDPTLARFLDLLLHHRLTGLFYRAWANHEPTVQLDRPGEDRFALYVGALIGLGRPALRDRDAAPDHAKLYYAGWYARTSRPAEGLAALLGDFLELPVRIVQWVGEWLALPEHSHCRLGAGADRCGLGTTAVLGARVFSRSQRFRVVVGPVGLADFRRLLPGSPTLARLAALVRLYAGDALTFELNPVLRGAEVPPLRLGGGAQLGLTSWLTAAPLTRDADELRLEPLRHAA